MSEIIRQLLDIRLPSEVIAQLGDYLNGRGVSDILAQQSGEVDAMSTPQEKMAMMNSGLRPSPMVNGLQLDR